MKKTLHYVLTRVFNTPLLIHPHKLKAIEAFIQTRMPATLFDEDHREPEADASVDVGGRSGAELSNNLGEVAVIPIYGTLVQRATGMDAMSGMVGYTDLTCMLNEAVEDPSITAILLDIDSCGGEANGCFELADRIFEAREKKPVLAVVNEQAFSAAYAIASGASRIFAPKTGNVGSIGVVCTHFDYSKMAEKEGVAITHIYAGRKKVDGSPYKPLSDSALKDFQAEVDKLYGVFVETVARNRGISTRAVRETEAGTFMGKSGLNAALIDEIISLADLPAKIQEAIMKRNASAPGPSTTANQPTPAADAAANYPDPGKKKDDDEDEEASAAASDEEEEEEEAARPTPAPSAIAATADAVAAARGIAAEITNICTVAGKPALAAQFIKDGLSLAQAKVKLFDTLASEGAPIINAHDPTRTGESEGETLLVGAMRALNETQQKKAR